MSQEPPGDDKGHRFGGPWTDQKLDILGRYLAAYTTALKNFSFKKGYIDAFAGTGTRVPRRSTSEQHHKGQGSLFDDDESQIEGDLLLDGSARIALSVDPPFDGFIFIDKSKKHCDELEELRTEFPDRSIQVRRGDANKEIRKICRSNWNSRRAVLFLDPYGGQVEWDTIEAVAGTKAIDLWLLFPLGTVVSRLLKRTGDIPEGWRRRLTLLLGTEDWYDEIYKVEKVPSLFGDDLQTVEKASIEVIGQRFNERLSTVFAGVAERPKVLVNSRNCPLYLFCFAAGNPRGAPVAIRIAQSLLDRVST